MWLNADVPTCAHGHLSLPAFKAQKIEQYRNVYLAAPTPRRRIDATTAL
jgi:hypothetical protein